MPSFYEFFAGGGMARAGLGPKWRCLFANEIDPKKAASYGVNWGAAGLRIQDVAELTPADLPGRADLAWASFPCQDLSLAGNGAGLRGQRSGTFWPFWRLMRALAPPLIVLENVCGALTSHGGKDFAAIGAALRKGGYRFGALVMDAVHFVPQSRPRLFIVAVRRERAIPQALRATNPDPLWHPNNLLACDFGAGWVWWRVPAPPARRTTLSDLLEETPQGVRWHSAEETRRLLALMTPLHCEKVARAGCGAVGALYKRTRPDGKGGRVQRAEVRFDGLAGCLRTPAGGSSRQSVVLVERNQVRSRLLSPRETARLMGLPDAYRLPLNHNDAYHLTGDGVVVPVVRHLAAHLLEPLLG